MACTGFSCFCIWRCENIRYVMCGCMRIRVLSRNMAFIPQLLVQHYRYRGIEWDAFDVFAISVDKFQP